VTPDDASELVALQSRDFESYRRKLAEIAPEAAEHLRAAQEKRPPVRMADTPPPAPRSRLTLSNEGALLGERQIAQELARQAERAAQLAKEIKELAEKELPKAVAPAASPSSSSPTGSASEPSR
jgi:pilus assembly protein FimV